MGLIDTHAHLEMLSSPVEEVLARAKEAGVEAVISVGDSLESSEGAIALAARFDGNDDLPRVFATVGVHPHNSRSYDEQADARLRELAAQPGVVAVGETGLDFFYDSSPREDQLMAFAAQIRIARETGLPLVVHDREAHRDTLETLRAAMPAEQVTGDPGELAPLTGAVIHCFSGDPAWANRFLGLGCHLSITGVVTFRNAGPLRDAAASTPLNRLMLETDSPYLSPEPYRGQENEPARLPCVAERIASLRGVPLQQLVESTSNTARAFFRLRGRATALFFG